MHSISMWKIAFYWFQDIQFVLFNSLISGRSFCKTNFSAWYLMDGCFKIWKHFRASHEKKIGHHDCSPWANGELTVRSWWPKWSQPAMTEPWPGPWLSCDHTEDAVIELWPRRDWAVTSPWPLLAVTEPWSLGPGAVTSVVSVSSRWPFIFSWDAANIDTVKCRYNPVFGGPINRSRYSGHRVIAAGSAMDVFGLVFKQRGSWALLGNLSFIG